MTYIIQKQLKDLQPGENVVVMTGIRNDEYISTVVRTTKTQVIILDSRASPFASTKERRYRIDDGYEIGSSNAWYRNRIKVSTNEDLVIIEMNNRYKKLTTSLNINIDRKNESLINEVYDFLNSKGLLP